MSPSGRFATNTDAFILRPLSGHTCPQHPDKSPTLVAGRDAFCARRFNGLATHNVEPALQFNDLTFAPLFRPALSDLKAQPETARPACERKDNHQATHGNSTAPARRRRRPQCVAMVANLLRSIEQS
jgi:hypothetical protein